ncbi:hypothetical protein DRN75_01050 [Nanoarchaeota archaeon]|nr:MAG: hypothetical protein DRN75_01050 [Nanoarchaeota archaeon]
MKNELVVFVIVVIVSFVLWVLVTPGATEVSFRFVPGIAYKSMQHEQMSLILTNGTQPFAVSNYLIYVDNGVRYKIYHGKWMDSTAVVNGTNPKALLSEGIYLFYTYHNLTVITPTGIISRLPTAKDYSPIVINDTLYLFTCNNIYYTYDFVWVRHDYNLTCDRIQAVYYKFPWLFFIKDGKLFYRIKTVDWSNDIFLSNAEAVSCIAGKELNCYVGTSKGVLLYKYSDHWEEPKVIANGMSNYVSASDDFLFWSDGKLIYYMIR